MVRIIYFDPQLDSLLSTIKVDYLMNENVLLVILECIYGVFHFGVLAEEESFGDR